ncbi:FtsJ methyltransferase domain-containing protein 2 [Podochytrium sp. JEL0797]|nr:FtsJ methyltransferase domain-containing protein 2 [Podochytrium sp. JEL0797]
MSLFANDPKYLATPAESTVPPPRMMPPNEFNRNQRGGGGGRGRGRGGFPSNNYQRNDPYARDSRDQGGYRDARDSRDSRDMRDPRDSRDERYARDSRDARDNRPPPQHHQQQQQGNFTPTNTAPAPIEWIEASSTGTVEVDAQMRKAALPDHDMFCYAALVNLLAAKRTAVASLDPRTLTQSRNATNPFTLVTDHQRVFLNRAAVKLCQLDHLASLTTRLAQHPSHAFVDLCAGPGGFAEYLLWKGNRKMGVHPRVTGTGITLRGQLDFDARFLSTHAQDFVPAYGKDSTGNLTRLENLDHFVNGVMERYPSRVGLVTADGAFSCAGDELYQEDQSKMVLLAQVVTMFRVLAPRGDFVVKTFELLTPFSVGVVYLLYKSFARVAIVKPSTSRPANSERYIVCRDFVNVPTVEMVQSLREALGTLYGVRQPPVAAAVGGGREAPSHHTETPTGFISLPERVALGLFDVYSVVDVDAVMRDEKFVDWIKESNVKITMRQTDALGKIEKFAQSGEGAVMDQQDVMTRCWREWGMQ